MRSLPDAPVPCGHYGEKQAEGLFIVEIGILGCIRVPKGEIPRDSVQVWHQNAGSPPEKKSGRKLIKMKTLQPACFHTIPEPEQFFVAKIIIFIP